ncbi:hypothetical protein P5G51_019230 [Virgibacillus sp. 179-BFC.A HS]|uniref:Uncharacterized protein n=1 Tax=Tigheibacillus jepli TaxID=3035914 RepID=A0ABU5CLD9_9BACI|nr:hypothetical protein [Virgibacillus sp. 179-BFC.A HS]MDY0407177.1 hypothetical protein [Virgibacillus sp. 179-BFC.A HS]
MNTDDEWFRRNDEWLWWNDGGFGIIGYIINLVVIGAVVYIAVKLAMRK